jgi:hypothetical protein
MEATKQFRKLVLLDALKRDRPDAYTVQSMLGACAATGALSLGFCAHVLVLRELRDADHASTVSRDVFSNNLAVLENLLDFRPNLVNKVCGGTKLLRWLLTRINACEFDGNEQYGFEVLTILLWGSRCHTTSEMEDAVKVFDEMLTKGDDDELCLCGIGLELPCTMEVQACGHQRCVTCRLVLCCHSKPNLQLNSASSNLVVKSMVAAKECYNTKKLSAWTLLTGTFPDKESYILVVGLLIGQKLVDTPLKCWDMMLKSGYMPSPSIFIDSIQAGVEEYLINMGSHHAASFPHKMGFTLEDATGLDVTRMLQGQFGNALTYKQPWPPPGFSSLMYEKDKGNDVELGDIHVSARGGAADDKVQFVILGDCVQVWIPSWPSFSGATACVKCTVYTSLLLFDNQPWFWKFLLSFQGSLVGTIGSMTSVLRGMMK